MGNSDATAAHIAELHAAWRARWWEQILHHAFWGSHLLGKLAVHAGVQAEKWRGYEAHNRDEMVRVMGGAPRSIR